MHASVNVGWQGKSGPGKIHEVILVFITHARSGMRLNLPAVFLFITHARSGMSLNLPAVFTWA